MNSWTELYKEFEQEPEMIKFRAWCFKNGFEDGGLMISFHKSNIKMIFGLLQCYAETQGYNLIIIPYGYISEHCTYIGKIAEIIGRTLSFRKELLLKQAMLWCAKKYFEITKGE